MTFFSSSHSSGAPTYRITASPTELPVTLDELKLWLRITNTAQDDLLTSIIKGVTASAQNFTKRTFINTQYVTYRDHFGDFVGEYDVFMPYPLTLINSSLNRNEIQIRRTPLTSIQSIQYVDEEGDVIVIDASDYYFTINDGSTFSDILPEEDIFWPTDLNQKKLQQITIDFTAGWADQAEFLQMEPELHEALLAHMTDVYVNRGDCSNGSTCSCQFAPPQSITVYTQNRIIDFAAL